MKGQAKRRRPKAKHAPSVAVRAVRTAKTRLIEVRGDSRYLGEDERTHIAGRLREKATVRAIAAELARSPFTVCRKVHPAPCERPVPATHRTCPRSGQAAPPQGREDRGVSAAA